MGGFEHAYFEVTTKNMFYKIANYVDCVNNAVDKMEYRDLANRGV